MGTGSSGDTGAGPETGRAETARARTGRVTTRHGRGKTTDRLIRSQNSQEKNKFTFLKNKKEKKKKELQISNLCVAQVTPSPLVSHLVTNETLRLFKTFKNH